MNHPLGDSLHEKFSSCLAILNRGGGVFNVKLDSGDHLLSDIFDSAWIINEHSSLNMVTVRIPSHGSFSLLHPGILFWEEDRSDFLALDEGE